jgi:hypothetical protein
MNLSDVLPFTESNDVDASAAIAWNAVSAAAAIGAGLAARRAAEAIWGSFSDEDAPTDPSLESTTWPAAVTWAVLAGALAGVARVVGRRGAAVAWRRVTGDEVPA